MDGVRVTAQRSAEEGLAGSICGICDDLLSCDVNFASTLPVLRPDHQHMVQGKGAQQLMASSQRRKRLSGARLFWCSRWESRLTWWVLPALLLVNMCKYLWKPCM